MIKEPPKAMMAEKFVLQSVVRNPQMVSQGSNLALAASPRSDVGLSATTVSSQMQARYGLMRQGIIWALKETFSHSKS